MGRFQDIEALKAASVFVLLSPQVNFDITYLGIQSAVTTRIAFNLGPTYRWPKDAGKQELL